MNSALSMNSAIDSSIHGQMDLGGSLSPALLACISVVIILYYYIFARVGSTTVKIAKQAPSVGSITLEIILWGLFIFIVGINAMQYYYNINIKTDLKSLLSGAQKIKI